MIWVADHNLALAMSDQYTWAFSGGAPEARGHAEAIATNVYENISAYSANHLCYRGRGIRIIFSENELAQEYSLCKKEAQAAFDDC